MSWKELLAPVFLRDGKAVRGFHDAGQYEDGDAVRLAAAYDNGGIDSLLVFDLSESDAQHEEAVSIIKEIARAVDIPLYAGGNINRLEDVKKLIYAGCRKVFLNFSKESNVELAHEASLRFGKEKILACVKTAEELKEAKAHEVLLGGFLLFGEQPDAGGGSEDTAVYVITEECSYDTAASLLKNGRDGVCPCSCIPSDSDIRAAKHRLRGDGVAVNTFESSVAWEDMKLNSDGMVPVVVQDYKTQEVLMVAYMNREAFETTVRTGKMTYWSRSRNELWVKGQTSGHVQYVKEIRLDCDSDTLLAMVAQVGAACHTGSRSCFYRTILKKEYDETNPLKVFEDVFHVIQDRRLHPKEGSYTNYLFDKGIDKILKKVGEEATEIIIAAKNPDPEEIKYEISDFLYHVMVLMAQKGVTWEDITKELARR